MPQSSKRVCWNCHLTTDTVHFCLHCHKILPTPNTVDFFSFFSLPVKLNLDGRLLTQNFYELSRKFHPDFYQKAGEREREISTEKASLLNKAYQTLRNPWRRAEYAVSLEGFDAKKNTGAASPELLNEMMTLQEEISGSQEQKHGASEGQAMAMRNLQDSFENLKRRLAGLLDKLEGLFKEWDESTNRHPVAEKIVRLLHERKYLETALKNAQKALEQAR